MEDGNKAFKAGDAKKAIELYLDTWRRAPHDARVPLNLALALIKDGSLVPAMDCCLKALAQLPVKIHPFSDPTTGMSTWIPPPDFHSDLAAKGFARLGKAMEAIASLSTSGNSSISGSERASMAALALRAARASSLIVRSAVAQNAALKFAERDDADDADDAAAGGGSVRGSSVQNQPLVLRRTNDAAFERHLLGNTGARLVGQGIDLSNHLRYDLEKYQPCRLGFFGCGDVRNALATLWILSLDVESKEPKDTSIPVEVHLNDVNYTLLARDIVLLVIAARSCDQKEVAGTLGTPLLFFAGQCHHVLYGCQRRTLDLILSRLVHASSSLTLFKKKYPWLEIHNAHGEGGDVVLQELRWIWIRWTACRHISTDVLARHQRSLNSALASQIMGMAHPEHPVGTEITADVESRCFFAQHGMLPLTPSIRAGLGDGSNTYELEAEELEGNYRFVNPLLICPYSGAMRNEAGPESPYREMFEVRDPAPSGLSSASGPECAGLAAKRHKQMRG
jgi:hypothetical protein